MLDIADIVELEGMRVFSLPAALVGCSARFFSQCPVDARTALALIHDAQDMLRRLLAGRHSTIAGRLAGAFRGMGGTRMANDIVGAMRAAGFTVREGDPFGARAANSVRARTCWRRSCRRGLHGRPVASNLPKRDRVPNLFSTRFGSESPTLPGYRTSPGSLPLGGGRSPVLLHAAGDTSAMATLTMDLPDKLAEEAGEAGLLASDALETMLRENLRRCAIDGLFEAADMLAASDFRAMTMAEIQAEVNAVRSHSARRRLEPGPERGPPGTT